MGLGPPLLALAMLLLASSAAQATESGTPLPPTMVTAQATNGGILVSWQPPVDDGGSPVESYAVLRSDDGLTWIIRAIIPADATTYLDQATTAPAIYRVQAVNDAGPSLPSQPSPVLLKLNGIGNTLTDPPILAEPCPLLIIGGDVPFFSIHSDCLDGILRL